MAIGLNLKPSKSGLILTKPPSRRARVATQTFLLTLQIYPALIGGRQNYSRLSRVTRVQLISFLGRRFGLMSKVMSGSAFNPSIPLDSPSGRNSESTCLCNL